MLHPGARGAGGSRGAMTLLDVAPRVVTIGLDIFAEDLQRGGVSQVHVDWRPPAGGDPKLAALLGRLTARSEIDSANATALSRLVEGDPVLVDCRPAHEAIGLPERTVL